MWDRIYFRCLVTWLKITLWSRDDGYHLRNAMADTYLVKWLIYFLITWLRILWSCDGRYLLVTWWRILHYGYVMKHTIWSRDGEYFCGVTMVCVLLWSRDGVYLPDHVTQLRAYTTIFTFASLLTCQRDVNNCLVSANTQDVRCFGVCLGPRAINQSQPSLQPRYWKYGRTYRFAGLGNVYPSECVWFQAIFTSE